MPRRSGWPRRERTASRGCTRSAEAHSRSRRRHDARARAGGRRQDPGQRRLRDGRRGARRWRSKTDHAAGRRPIADRRHGRHDVVDVGRPGRRDRRRRGARGRLAPRRQPPMPASSRSCRSVAGPFAGWERADSIVVNPHKWLFTPLDASLLLTRRMDQLRAAFSLVPEYLRTLDRATPGPRLQRVPAAARSADAGAQAVDAAPLVRARGAAAADRLHLEWPSGSPAGSTPIRTGSGWRPVPFSTVCFRYRPAALAGRGRGGARPADDLNARLMDAVNRSGEVFLSHTRLRGPVRDPCSRSGTCERSRATSSGRGRCCAARPPASTPTTRRPR